MPLSPASRRAVRSNRSRPSVRGAAPAALFAAALSLGSAQVTAQPAQPIRWACIGNSITQGSGYPARLQALLGPAFQVENDGVGGTTMLKQSNFPYWTRGKFAQAFAFKPDIVTVKLGANDSKPVNWPAGKSTFLADTKAMVDTLAKMPGKPLTFLCYPVPAFQKNGAWVVDGINEPVIKNEIMPLIRQAAEEKKVGLIDLHTFLEKRGDLFAADGVHPDGDKAGADSIALGIYRAFKAQAVRIACIGNSITDNGHNGQAYPVKLNQRLGRQYLVLNAGHSGRTLLRQGDNPFYKSEWFKEVFKFQPHEITIKLGTNDSKPHNWDAHKDEFVGDLRWLIDTLSTIPTRPKIILCTPIPAWKAANGTDPFGIRGDVIKNEIIPKIRQVAQERGLKVLDLHTPYLPYQSLTPDGVHPNAVGLDTLSAILHRAYRKEFPVALSGHGPADNGVRDRLPAFRSPSIMNPLAPLGIDAAGRRFE